MEKRPRAERNYIATKGVLNRQHRTNPNRTHPPFSRPVLESGTAVKTVYLSKAPQSMTVEQMEKALEHHEYLMRKEIQASGRIVRKVIKTLAGMEGDCRIQMMWEILGTKRTKNYRKLHKNATIPGNAGAVDTKQGSAAESGRDSSQEGHQAGAL